MARVDSRSTSTQRLPRSAARTTRLASEKRRDQLLDAAAALIVEQGFLPLPVERLARKASVSKALIYAYFPTQYELFNALLTRELAAMSAMGLDEAIRGKALKTVAVDAATIYFDHVSRWGPLLHVVFGDLYMAGRFDRQAITARNRIMRRLARLVRRATDLPAKEIMAGINMVMALPEEAGALVFHHEIDPHLARDMCRTLTLGALKGLAQARRAS